MEVGLGATFIFWGIFGFVLPRVEGRFVNLHYQSSICINGDNNLGDS